MADVAHRGTTREILLHFVKGTMLFHGSFKLNLWYGMYIQGVVCNIANLLKVYELT